VSGSKMKSGREGPVVCLSARTYPGYVETTDRSRGDRGTAVAVVPRCAR